MPRTTGDLGMAARPPPHVDWDQAVRALQTGAGAVEMHVAGRAPTPSQLAAFEDALKANKTLLKLQLGGALPLAATVC